jgi:hypothetical protein
MEKVESSQEIVVVDGGNSHVANDTSEDGFGAIFVNGEYQPKAHFACEKRRFENDTKIPQMVDEYGQEVCDFVEVTSAKAGTVTILTYHPNPKAELTPELSWTDKPALYVKNAGRFYKEASNGRIVWHYKVLQGSIFELIERDFSEDFMAGNYKNNEREKFCKKVARFIQDYPHECARKYGVYLKNFKDMISAMDSSMDDISLESLMISICKCMTRVLDYNDRTLPEKEIYLKVIDASSMFTVQQCSKNVHYRLGLIDVESQSAKNDLLELSSRADKQRENERLEKQAKIDEMKARMSKFSKNKTLPAVPAKRKIEEISDANDEEDHGAKRQKTISNDQATVDQDVNDQN